MGEIHSEDSIAGLERGEIDRHIRLASGVRLNVYMIGTEESFCALYGKVLRDIDKLAPAIVSLARIPFRIFVRHNATLGLKHRLAHEIFRGNEFEFAGLPSGFIKYSPGYFRISIPQKGHYLISSSMFVILSSRFL